MSRPTETQNNINTERTDDDISLPKPPEAARKDEVKYFDKVKQESKTATALAYVIVAIFAAALVAHHVILAVFYNTALTVENPEQIEACITGLQATYNVWFPALVGIVSAVTTYYFTRDRK